MKLIKYFHIDWVLFFSILPLLASGLVAMRSFGAQSDYYFFRQLIWIAIGVTIFFLFSTFDWRFLRKGEILVGIFLLIVASLVPLIIVGSKIKGAASWYSLTLFSLSPSDPAKIALILILAKYFSRRHVEIARFKHIIISGIYALIFFGLVFFQPDFGSAVVIFMIWFGMVMASGINKKHLLYLGLAAVVVLVSAWMFVLKPYQKDRVINFLHPLQDIRGSGYNAYQSKVAIGSGGLFGKGIGFGTQSRLEFLPEHQTDFIFAAFAEEWGLAGVFFIFTFYSVVVWRILKNALLGQSNFESLFGIGLAVFLMAQFIIHVGMNIGLLPVTGLGLPLMSYGGSSLITVFAALGILMGMRKYSRITNREEAIINF